MDCQHAVSHGSEKSAAFAEPPRNAHHADQKDCRANARPVKNVHTTSLPGTYHEKYSGIKNHTVTVVDLYSEIKH
eukprot:1883653-Amphidinium_carterae.1